MRTPVTFVLAACLSGSAMAQTPGQKATNAPDAAKGHHLFMADGCYECHGTVGQGGVGPRLAPDPLPADAIAQYIRHPANTMPPYVEQVLGDPDVRDIQAYLASIPQPPPVKDVQSLLGP